VLPLIRYHPNYLYPCLEATRIIGIKIPLIGYESYL
ncbi:MAG: hypothetical protein ACI8RD_001172, partial [Bacillariaceae sp.]